MEKHDMGGFALLAAHSEERGFDMQTDARKSCKWEGDWWGISWKETEVPNCLAGKTKGNVENNVRKQRKKHQAD